MTVRRFELELDEGEVAAELAQGGD